MKPDHERVTKLLTDTVTLLCKNGLSYERELRIQGLLGITVDSSEVFLVSINDCFDCCSSTSSASVPVSSVQSLATSGSSQSRKRSGDDIVDLTRFVETPGICTGVQPYHLSSSISPMHQNTQARPKSTGSVGQTRSQAITPSSSNLALTDHAQPIARQSSFAAVMTAGNHSATNVCCRNIVQHLTSSNSQYSNAVAVHQSQRSHQGYADSIRNLMLACERQLQPNSRQHPRQLASVGASGWTGTDQQHAMQHRPVHQCVAAVGGMSAAAAGDLVRVGRPVAEQSHYGISPHQHRQSMVPILPGNTYPQRSVPNPLQHVHQNAVVQEVAGAPPPLTRQLVPVRQLYYDPAHCVGTMQQVRAAAQGRHLVDGSVYAQPLAKRHAPNHLPRQAMQSFNPDFVQNHLPHSHSYFAHNHLTTFSQHQVCSVADAHAVNSVVFNSTSTSQSSRVTSSPIIKPPSSPVRSGHRPRPRPTEHIDLCGDDETTDGGGIDIPLSSIVIQPDNIGSPSASDEPEGSNSISVNTSESYVHDEFEIVPENEDNLPPLSYLHEIVPLDDGIDNECDVFTVATENAGHSASEHSASASDSVTMVTGGLSDSERESVSSHLISEPLAVQMDVHPGAVSHDEIGSQLVRLSADESRRMAELYFDAEDNDTNAQM